MEVVFAVGTVRLQHGKINSPNIDKKDNMNYVDFSKTMGYASKIKVMSVFFLFSKFKLI